MFTFQDEPGRPVCDVEGVEDLREAFVKLDVDDGADDGHDLALGRGMSRRDLRHPPRGPRCCGQHLYGSLTALLRRPVPNLRGMRPSVNQPLWSGEAAGDAAPRSLGFLERRSSVLRSRFRRSLLARCNLLPAKARAATDAATYLSAAGPKKRHEGWRRGG